MQTNYFRVNKKEYCHFTSEYIFISNTKDPTRIPLEYELSEAWAVMSVFNYIFFALIFGYCAISINILGFLFFKQTINYGALFLMLLSFRRIQVGFNSSKSPSIKRINIINIYLKTPAFSFPRVVIYFKGPEKKTLKRIIAVRYKAEATKILIAEKLL